MRKAWREGKRIRKQTLANLTHLPPELVEGIRRVLKGGVHSLPSLLDDLATLTLNTVHLPDNPENRFNVATRPTPLQRRAFELLDVDPAKMFPVRVQVE